ncbi:hypothetical protein [Flaviaesturariibacter terrae]
MFEKIPSYEALLAARLPDGSEPPDRYKAVAAELDRLSGHEFKARAAFIRDQCAGFDGKAIFAKYRDRWGLPAAVCELRDMKRGFLYCFRDGDGPGSTAARAWFLASEEARSVRRYEYWSSERGFPECVDVAEGSYDVICKKVERRSGIA